MAFNLTPIDGEIHNSPNGEVRVWDDTKKVWNKQIIYSDLKHFEFIGDDTNTITGIDALGNNFVISTVVDRVSIYQQGSILNKSDYTLTDANTVTFTSIVPTGHELIIISH